MPELPEVETTRRGIAPHIEGCKVTAAVVRESRLRWPVTHCLADKLVGQTLVSVDRRAKYLLLKFEFGELLVHLGMSGSLRIVAGDTPVAKHDHVDLVMSGGTVLRYNDPRRFGAVLWCEGGTKDHALLQHLGPEPLGDQFDAGYLHGRARGRKQAVKSFLMDNHVVVGVGNIYANEALFMAGIDPRRPAGRIALARYQGLVGAVKTVLQEAIDQGGTTLRDFVGGDGKPGYFQQQLRVYGREGQPCRQCAASLQRVVIGQRATVFCPVCQR